MKINLRNQSIKEVITSIQEGNVSYKIRLATALAACLLNGCATVALWDEYDSGTTTVERHEEKDTIVGFARVKANSEKLPPNSLVMLGDNYVYVLKTAVRLDKSDGKVADLAAILNVKLSQAFELHALGVTGNKPSTASRLNSFPVNPNKSTPNKFFSSFCLSYPENAKLSITERRREQAELDKLSFRQVQTNNGAIAYVHCLVTVGEIYTKPDSLKYDYRFQTALPVSIYTTTIHKSPARGAAWRTLLTPFTAAVDIVALPITVPLGIKVLEGIGEGWH